MKIFAVVSLSAALLASSSLAAQTVEQVTVVHAGQLLDKPGTPPRGPSTVIIRNGKVAEILAGHQAGPAGAKLIDLKDKFVPPGLIDSHVHLDSDAGGNAALIEAVTDSPARAAYRTAGNAKKTLMAGFTTVRNLGDSDGVTLALRDAVAAGKVPGPRIVDAGTSISTTSGHMDPTLGYRDELHAALDVHGNTCDGADDCRRAVRRQVGRGAQVIKFMATGGVLSNVSGGLGRAMMPEEMKAVIDTAHALGRKVAAHSHAKEGTAAAVEAGVDTIDHGTFLDDATVRLMKARGTWLVPTMIAPVTALQQARAGLLPPATIPKAEEAGAAARESHRRAIAAGVRIAFGTDSGVSKHGENAKEFALMVDAGMTPAQAIKAATADAAEALGRPEIGRIAPGMAADIIAVDGDPLADVRQLEDVDFVMKAGKVVRRD